MLFVNDIFYSIQGESSFAGYPCLFIRLAGCNINCSYCDTPDALSIEDSRQMKTEEIMCELTGLSKNIKLVEITGGEPLMQEGVHDLFKVLIGSGYKILLETNGTIVLRDVPQEVVKIVDIKCPSSGFSGYVDYKNLEYIKEDDEIKFVIGTEEDYNFAKNFLLEQPLKTQKIIFSPVAGRIAPGELALKILKDEISVRLGLQIHKVINLK